MKTGLRVACCCLCPYWRWLESDWTTAHTPTFELRPLRRMFSVPPLQNLLWRGNFSHGKVSFFMFIVFKNTHERCGSMQILSCRHRTDGLGNTELCELCGLQDPGNLREVWAEDLVPKTVKGYWVLHDRCVYSFARMPLNKAILISRAHLKNIIQSRFERRAQEHKHWLQC